ncbi:50S ribosomal protein L22 [Candidatus Daviesbacteria bacterium]|nr:50S ribosomal protein L22 [Candidatus Daviesbacteria bacterium]
MEITTIQKFIHTSPRKLRLVADMVRKMAPFRAVDVLKVTPKAAAKDLVKAIETVLANTKQKGLDVEKVVFKKIEINEGTKMKRYRAGTRGRTKPFKRRMAHIKIVLTDEINLKSQMSRQRRGSPLAVNVKTETQNLKLKKEKGGKKAKVVMDNSAESAKQLSKIRTELVQNKDGTEN